MNNPTSNTSPVLALIEKLISKTKNNSINWKTYASANIELKSLPRSPLDDLAPVFNTDIALIDPVDSYVAECNDGVFFLLLYKNVFGNELVLRVQTQSSTTSQIYASTKTNVEDLKISSQLKRLYNLADSKNSTSEVDSFINSFINGE